MEKLSTLVIGAGDRGNKVIHRARDMLEVTAVAEPNDEKRNAYADKHNVERRNRFVVGEAALNAGLGVDMVYIATPDKTHRDLAVQALENGYNVLLEKPMATTEQDCRDIIEAQKESESALSVCHVLRYAPFFTTLKTLVDSKELGDVLGIDLTEEVGSWHFAHSYVRGNWNQEAQSSPVILAKSCHDLDLLSWFANSEAESVVSTGGLDHFNWLHSPEDAPQRCTDGCKVDCRYDARKFYLGKHTVNDEGLVTWPFNVISVDTSEEARQKAIEEGPYGRCVYKSDNDVCDNQDVSIKFRNGINADFRLRSRGPYPERKITIYFENGDVLGSFHEAKIIKTTYSGRAKGNKAEEIALEKLPGHGGGDELMVRNFIDLIQSGDPGLNKTSAGLSLQSHLIAFAAEESRKTGKRISF